MALYLVQHALSLPKDKDPEKGISPQGRSDALRIAEVAKGYDVAVSRILHSGKKRALETAAIFAEALTPTGGIAAAAGLNPMDDVAKAAETMVTETGLMIVGHLPFMERLTAFLVTGKTEKPVFKFQNAGIVCLENDPEKGGWVIVWSLIPNIR
ncbi:MAG: phosphohistidine phosphatase SixA [Desulfobacterales bacterium]|nr:phosphohistidine phosphatase SixA [Desulfobacterales bacterium]